MESSGWAKVLAIEECPPIANGDGEVVTGRFITPTVSNLVRLTFAGGVDLTGTHLHPIWSLDRQSWVPLGELHVNEHVLGENGPVSVRKVEHLTNAQDVYNIEVHGEHVYQVTDLGVLVHNAKNYAPDVPSSAPRGVWSLTAEGASKMMRHGTFGTFFKSKSDGLWWAVDNAGHGGSAFKVFKETGTGLEWIADADSFGDFIVGKHKGPTGLFIPWKQLRGA